MRNYLIILGVFILATVGCSLGTTKNSVTQSENNPGGVSTARAKMTPSGSPQPAVSDPSIVLVGRTGDDGKKLVSVAADGTVFSWDSNYVKEKLFSVNGSVTGATLAPHGDLLAVFRGSRIGIFSNSSKSQIAALSRLHSNILSGQFDPDETSILLGCADGNVYRWHFNGSEELQDDPSRVLERYIGHPTIVSAVAVHPTGKMFFSGDWQGQILAWRNYNADEYQGEYDKNVFDANMFGEKGLRALRGAGGGAAIEKLVLSGDGNYLLAGFASGVVELWSVRGFKLLTSQQAHRGVIYDLQISADGTRVVTVGRDGIVKFWKIQQTAEPSKLSSPITYSIVSEKDTPLPNVRRILFRGDRVNAGTIDGKILELQ